MAKDLRMDGGGRKGRGIPRGFWVSGGSGPVLDPAMSDSIADLTTRIRAFVAARDWEQYHNPKDMAVAIAAEAGELMQHFVWQQPEQIEKRAVEKRDEIASEIADVGILLFEMADLLGLKLGEVMEAKIARNEQRYPADKSRGNNLKYNEL
jgi:NTP pyrophosphatase (non-canonical NTP hydrolase)